MHDESQAQAPLVLCQAISIFCYAAMYSVNVYHKMLECMLSRLTL